MSGLPVGALLPNGEQQFFDSNGDPLAGGFVYMYLPGTTTPATTWVDPYLLTPNTNPIVLDSGGRAIIWGNQAYRQVVTDQFGNLIWDQITSNGISSAISISIPNIAALRALNITTNGTTAWLLGYVNAGDKEPVLYVFSSSSAAADNGGTVIKPTVVGSGAGRWIAATPDDFTVNLVDFGPVGQGADDTSAMLAAVATGYNVRLPGATLNFNTVSSGIVIPVAGNQIIIGAGPYNTFIQCNQSGASVFKFTASGGGVRDLQFNCPSMTDGWLIECSQCLLITIRNIEVAAGPGLISFDGGTRFLFLEDFRAAKVLGGSVSLVDGSGSTLKAALYGWGNGAAPTSFSQVWFIYSVSVFGPGPTSQSSCIGLYLNGAANSTFVINCGASYMDTFIVTDNTFGVSGQVPNFTHFHNIAAQTCQANLLSQYMIQLRAGANYQFTGGTFLNNAATGGAWLIGSGVTNVDIMGGLECAGFAQNGLVIAGQNVNVRGGMMRGAGNVTSTNISNMVVVSTAENVLISGMYDWGGPAQYDLTIQSGAQSVMLVGNSWTGGAGTPSRLNDPNLIGQYWPAVVSSWTPVFQFATPGNAVFTYSQQQGDLWQDGDWIVFNARLTAQTNAYNLTSTGGPVTIGGLPVAAGGDGTANSAAIGWFEKITLDSGYTQLTAEIQPSTNYITLWECGSSTTAQNPSTQNFTSNTLSIGLHVSGRYQV